MNIYETLAQRIKFAREQKELTQLMLAKKSGLKQSDISKLETGRMSSTTAIVKLAKALQCSVVWLDSGKGKPWDLGSNKALEAYLINIPIQGKANFNDTKDQFVKIHSDIEQSYLHYFSTDLDSYAIQSMNDNLSPRIKLAEYIIVKPNHSITNGDEVLIINHDNNIMIKQYVYNKNNHQYFCSINNISDIFPLDESQIKALHFIAAYIK